MLPSRPGTRTDLRQMGNNSLVSFNIHFYRLIETPILNVTGVWVWSGSDFDLICIDFSELQTSNVNLIMGEKEKKYFKHSKDGEAKAIFKVQWNENERDRRCKQRPKLIYQRNTITFFYPNADSIFSIQSIFFVMLYLEFLIYSNISFDYR